MKNQTGLTLRIFARHVLQYKRSFFCLVFVVVTASVIDVIVPLYFKDFFDILSGQYAEATRQELIGVLFKIAILYAATVLAWRTAGFINNYFQPNVISSLGNTCFSYLHKHSFGFFEGHFIGSLVRRVNKFTGAYERILDRFIWDILQLAVTVAVILIVLFQRDLRLLLIVSVWLVLFLLVNWFMTRFKLKYDILRSERETQSTGVMADTFTNFANVKLFGGYGRELQRYAKVLEEVRKLRKFTWDLDTAFDAVQAIFMVGLEIGIFYFAIGMWEQGILGLGDFVLIQSYLLTIFIRVWDFGKMLRNIFGDLADAEDMTVVLNTPHEIQDAHGALDLSVTKGEICFNKVDFYYHNTRPIITGFNLSIKQGQRVAIVGPSGAGKSTLIKLLLRMHDLTGGSIMIDGQNICRVTQASLWANISLVPQEPILFHRTLMDNIRYSKPNASSEEVDKAARRAHCDDFIRDFPEGYETYVGERGVKLSGGERQRVAIARAILHNSPILVLDEATSSLDSESEGLIQDALAELMRDKTVIVIAHRLSTIMKMDRIVVIDGGKIVEDGAHAELLQKPSSLYYRLWSLQAGGFLS